MDPVIIAGAGPVGLTLALALARHEVPSIVLDQSGTPLRENPRTVVLRPDTAALLDRLGHKGTAADGTTWTGWRTVRRRQELQHIELTDEPAAGRHPLLPFPRGTDSATGTGDGGGASGGVAERQPSPLHLAQDRLRRGLLQAAHASCFVRTVPDCRLDSLEQDATGVTVHTCGSAATWWRGSFLVGCDGPRSTVRKLLGVGFPGRTAVDRYAVALVRAALPFPGEARLHWDPPWRGDTEVTARPLPDGLWRLDWRLPPVSATAAMSSRADLLTPDTLIAKIRDTLGAWCDGVPPYELHGSAEYPVHQRLAKRWRVDRAFLAGDSAHLLGTLGMQSVDEGLRDADNLAWRLAVAWHHGAADVLLDGYQAERRGAIGARLRAADQALPLLRPSGTLHSARRSVLSGSARRHSSLLSDGHLGTGLLGAPPVYPAPGSPSDGETPRGGRRRALEARTDPPVGGQVTDVPVTALDGTGTRLRERLGRDLLVVLVAPGTAVWESRHWLSAGLMPPLAAATAALPVRAELLVAETYPGSTAHTVLLIRPDGHLAAAMPGFRPAELRDHVHAVYGDGGGAEPPLRQGSEVNGP